VSSYNR